MKKIGLLALGLALALGVVAEAGSIPANRVPLQTYAVKKMNCYLQPNGVQKGWIDPGDYVVVTQIRSDGWAYGSYPVGNGRVSRWFRADDLVNNIGFANQERYSPKANTNTYTGPDHSRKFGSFNDNETLLVVSESGESRQFIYKLNNGGYKMAWAPYWDCWDARQAGKQQVNNNVINKNPIVKPVQREDKKQEQSSSYGVWKATARYRANTYDNPSLSGARAGWVTAGSDLEVLGENAKSYFIRYWADNGAKRERYVERTAVKGLNEDKDDKNIVPSGDYVWPIDAYNISCLFYYSGYNKKNETYNPTKHRATYDKKPEYGFAYWNAVDIAPPGGKSLPVKATADGTVEHVGNLGLKSYGPHVIIHHKDGRYSLYAHLSQGSILVKANQEVKKGQKIADSGYSLDKDKNKNYTIKSWHLHFAITEVGAWQYFRDKVYLTYGDRVIGANKTKASVDKCSKDATEWFNKHKGSYGIY